MNLKGVDSTVFNNQMATGSYQHLVLSGGITAQLHPAIVALGPYYGPVFNVGNYTDDALTQIVNGVSSETDPTRQKQVYQQWNDYVLDQSWVSVLTSNKQRVALSPAVQGRTYNMQEALDFTGAWLGAAA